MSERTQLIRAREHLGLTRPEFAKRIGASRHYIFVIETGLRDPSAAMMRRWVEGLGPGVTMDLFKPPPQSAMQREPAA
jgi:DNA-binding XRE family transcriptional regulator